MKKIKNISKVTGIYGTWKPSDVAFIKSLRWSIQDLIVVFYCQIRGGVSGWPDTSKDFFEISLTFSKVSNLRLQFNSMGLQQVTGFDIVDVSRNGLEKINFQIEDYENGIIAFYCEDIEVNEVSLPFKVAFV
jgi:hypothetical protein